MSITILLADDHRMMREGLRSALEEQPDLMVVGEADNGRAAVEMARVLAPNIIVMDISMSDLNGVEATHQILTHTPGARIIALSMHSDRHYVTRMLEAGALGYLLKNDPITEMVRAVREGDGQPDLSEPKDCPRRSGPLRAPSESGQAGARTTT